MADVRNRRLIYGRRQGHKLHPRQARLVRDMLPALRPDMTAQSMAGWFGGAHFDAYALEIGFGGGEHLAARAQENRKTGFIGCEPFINGVAKLLIAIEAAGWIMCACMVMMRAIFSLPCPMRCCLLSICSIPTHGRNCAITSADL